MYLTKGDKGTILLRSHARGAKNWPLARIFVRQCPRPLVATGFLSPVHRLVRRPYRLVHFLTCQCDARTERDGRRPDGRPNDSEPPKKGVRVTGTAKYYEELFSPKAPSKVGPPDSGLQGAAQARQHLIAPSVP